MSSFDYSTSYSLRELFEWVCVEYSLTEELPTLKPLHGMLRHMIGSIQTQQLDEGDHMFIPGIPKPEFVQQVRLALLSQAKSTVVAFSGASSSDDALPPGEAVSATTTSATGLCPVCGEHKAHLKAHLLSNKAQHGWSATKYQAWLASVKSPPEKTRPQ
jgi:hypothetical protein